MSKKKQHIIRTYSAGVFAGEIVRRKGQEVDIKNARRLWYWKGAASLSQLAVDGVSCPSECKFSVPAPITTVTQAIEIIEMTPKAVKSVGEVLPWKA